MPEKILEVKQLKIYYRTLQGFVKAVDGISFAMERGQIVGLAGESGCGKTTFCNGLILRKKPMQHMGGKALLLGHDLMSANKAEMRKLRYTNISLIPQSAMDSFSPTKKIKTLVSDLVRQHHIEADSDFFRKVKERFAQVNLTPDVLDSYPIELSGGMKQRVLMVIATMMNPDLLVADEISSALDVTSQRFVCKLLVDFLHEKFVGSVLFITHDLSILYQIAAKIIIMYAGHLVEVAPTKDIIHAPKHPYTKALITSLPRIGVRFKDHKLRGIEGVPPKLLEIGPGCRFRFRCPFADEICEQKTPPVENINREHSIMCHHWKKIDRNEHEHSTKR